MVETTKPEAPSREEVLAEQLDRLVERLGHEDYKRMIHSMQDEARRLELKGWNRSAACLRLMVELRLMKRPLKAGIELSSDDPGIQG